jgi:CHAT domain
MLLNRNVRLTDFALGTGATKDGIELKTSNHRIEQMTLHGPIPTLDELLQSVRSQNPEEELTIVGEIMQIFRSQNLAAQRQLLDRCPPFPHKEQLLEAIDLNNQAAHVDTLGLVAIAYSTTPPHELAIIFGKAGFSLANDYCKSPEPALTPEILFTALSTSIRGCSIALYTLGRYAELLEFSESALNALEQGNSRLENSTDEASKARVRNNLNFLRISEIEANMKCQRYEQAEALVEIQKKYIDRLTESDRSRFKNSQVLLHKLIVSPAVFPSEPASSNEYEFTAVFEQLESLVEMMLDYGQKNPNYQDKITSFISKIAEFKTSIEARSITSIEARTYLEDLMASFFSVSEIEQVKRNIDTANSIFSDPQKESDPVLIEQSLATLQAALQWTKAKDFSEEECLALWGISICYRRQEKLQPDTVLQKELAAKSVEMLMALRKNIELIRSRIIDPYKRVYWIKCYKYLFPTLCEQLYKLDRPLDLLNAIEGAKGRVLADVLTQKDDRPIADFDFSASVQQLPALMQQVGAHYLTYLVDDEETFAVLITKDGSLHTHSVAIGKTQLQQWLSDDSEDKNLLDPKNWGKRINAREKLPNLSELLAPFVSWLEPYAEAGLIQLNDHLCYSPDAFLHLIPLHYLPFLDKPFVCYVSVSRIHGAAALVELLKQPPEKPSRLTAVYVPAKKDSQNSKGELAAQQKLEDMRWTAYWLKDTKNMVGTIAAEATADLSTVTQLPFSQRLVHFSTHGIFPSENEQNQDDNVNPYHTSGLVLAKDGELPENGDGQGGTLLTPEEIIKGKLNFAGSHVTMQACVSGKAKEGIGGDAIGLDWALMLAKASSLLSTHWNVDAGGARLFSQTFYQYWLFENDYSRAQAWRKTILDLMEDPKTFRPYHWAAFSLSGDWR